MIIMEKELPELLAPAGSPEAADAAVNTVVAKLLLFGQLAYICHHIAKHARSPLSFSVYHNSYS